MTASLNGDVNGDDSIDVLDVVSTVGIILGGPIAIMITSLFSPETVGGVGFDAIWRGLSTLAGSWIGGGANQTAMLELYEYNPSKIYMLLFQES